ncbi:ArnT family glycosyltransferase [Flavobacteriaceae bacterium 14752]|uniref:ArnT family glycosyltransferase n=1 Tax=Mesohalobacter salilacus TaxID=2491711 RepID=UPI000F6439EF|nr:dolichyl-phosphate-mannose--protein mannosyltransferase [Flavobacteriaceae bacterium 14752]
MKIIDQHPILFLILIGLGLYAFNLSDLQVSIMEARNFNVARDMITENNWLLTTMNNLPRYEKPPFPAWFTTPFAYVFGLDSEWAYRIPTSIISILGIVYFYKFIRIWSPKRLAFYAALILATSFYFIVIRFEAPSDMYTHVTMLIGLYYLLKNHPIINWSKVLLGSVFFGLSILSKGPISPYTLFLPMILAYYFSFKMTFKNQWFKVLSFIILGVVIGGSWYFYVRYADPQTFLDIAETETQNWTDYHTRPFYYYWSFFIQSGIWTIPALVSLAFPYFKSRVKHKKLYLFSFLWTIIALILLSVVPEKKPRYLLPVLFPLALNTALVLQYLFKNKNNIISKIVHYFHYSILSLACLGLLALPLFVENHSSQFWLLYAILSFASISIGFFIVLNLKRKHFENLFWANIFLILMATLIGQSVVFLFKQNENYNPLSVNKLKNKDLPTLYYDCIEPEIIWEYGHNIKKSNPNELPDKNFRLLVSGAYQNQFKSEFPNLAKQASVQVFDRNYYRTGDRKRQRFVIYVYTIK